MNLYPVILGITALGGIAISIWGWRVMAKSKKVKSWPTVNGEIERTSASSESNDLLPLIIFSYLVDGRQYSCTFEFPAGTHPLPEFNQAYLNKYPVGTKVVVYYNPQQPGVATLEPETQGDWMILAFGIMLIIGSSIALVISYINR